MKISNQAKSKLPLKERIFERIKVTPSGCWEWQGAKQHMGHGLIRLKGKLEKTHRAAYRAFVGEIPKGLWVCHKCDNPPCCNPDHLFIGTAADNNADRDRKGRLAPLRGEAHGRSTLTNAQVENIRDRRAAGESIPSISQDFGVSPLVIYNAANGTTYKHLKKKPIKGLDCKIKIKAPDIYQIKARRAQGEPYKSIADAYGVSRQQISLICRGMSRKAESSREMEVQHA